MPLKALPILVIHQFQGHIHKEVLLVIQGWCMMIILPTLHWKNLA